MKNKTKIFSIVLFLSTFIMLVSCGKQKAEWKGTIEKVDGVTVVKNPKEPMYGEIVLELEENLKIGNENDENSMFYRGISVDVNKSGNIYVLDRGSFRIQIFDKDGRFLQTIGRQGQGPGEFEKPTYITLDEEGNIFVKDGPKIHLFDRNGDFLKSFPIPLNSNQYKITGEGNFLGERKTIMPPDKLSEDVVLMNDKSKILKTIASFPSINMDSMFNQRNRFTIQAPELCFCPGIKDLAVYGFPSEYKLFVVNSSGEIKKIIEKNEPSEKISAKERKKIIDKIMDDLKRRRPEREESRTEIQKRTYISKFRPFFDEIKSDENGNLYVGKLKSYLSNEKGYEFDFFNNQGYYLYRLKITEGISNLNIIKWGHIYSTPYNQETGYFQVKRYKIKNWDQIKTGTQ